MINFVSWNRETIASYASHTDDVQSRFVHLVRYDKGKDLSLLDMEIISSELNPKCLDELRALFLSEWGEVDSFEGNAHRRNPPSPLLAIEESKLLGGLSFTWCRSEGFREMKLWVNAVFVKPDFRGKGIATSLIIAAANSAATTSENELFVYTEIPDLYTPLGWKLFSREEENHVLKISIPKNVESTQRG